MQPLATTRLVMTWLSMCSADESTTLRQKTAHIAYTMAILVLNVILFASSLAYCLKYFSVDFNSAAFGIMCTIGEFGAIYSMIAAILMCQRIFHIFGSLSSIYRSS